MSYEFYKLLHLIGVFLTLSGLAGMAIHVAGGGTKATFKSRALASATHGIGLVVTLVAGFGLLAKLGLMAGMPGWAIAKLVVWLILGALPALIWRKPGAAKMFYFLAILFAAFNGYLAIYKPF